MLPVDVYDELTGGRSQAAAEAAASLRTEGLAPSSDADAITQRWIRGEISTQQMRNLIRELHGLSVIADPYLDSDSGVLRNHLCITDSRRLRQVEADLTLAVLQDLSTRLLAGSNDLAHLQAFHREIFGDIYPWAGQIRTVAIAKTDPFCLPQHIESYSSPARRALQDLFTARHPDHDRDAGPHDRYTPPGSSTGGDHRG